MSLQLLALSVTRAVKMGERDPEYASLAWLIQSCTWLMLCLV